MTDMKWNSVVFIVDERTMRHKNEANDGIRSNLIFACLLASGSSELVTGASGSGKDRLPWLRM
jgi:hypothetical protein